MGESTMKVAYAAASVAILLTLTLGAHALPLDADSIVPEVPPMLVQHPGHFCDTHNPQEEPCCQLNDHHAQDACLADEHGTGGHPAGPCASVCPQEHCNDPSDAHKPECAECAKCHMEHNQGPAAGSGEGHHEMPHMEPHQGPAAGSSEGHPDLTKNPVFKKAVAACSYKYPDTCGKLGPNPAETCSDHPTPACHDCKTCVIGFMHGGSATMPPPMEHHPEPPTPDLKQDPKFKEAISACGATFPDTCGKLSLDSCDTNPTHVCEDCKQCVMRMLHESIPAAQADTTMPPAIKHHYCDHHGPLEEPCCKLKDHAAQDQCMHLKHFPTPGHEGDAHWGTATGSAGN